MEPRQPERRLAAILAADVEGYSRLMHADGNRDMIAAYLAKYSAGEFRPLAEILLAGKG